MVGTPKLSSAVLAYWGQGRVVGGSGTATAVMPVATTVALTTNSGCHQGQDVIHADDGSCGTSQHSTGCCLCGVDNVPSVDVHIAKQFVRLKRGIRNAELMYINGMPILDVEGGQVFCDGAWNAPKKQGNVRRQSVTCTKQTIKKGLT